MKVESARSGLPGSRVRMRLPSGFTRTMRHPTLYNERLKMVVSIAEMTVPEAEAAASLEGLERNILRSPKRVDVSRGSASGFVLRGAKDDEMDEAIVALHDGACVAMLFVVYPSSAAAEAEAIIESVWLDASAVLDPPLLSALSFGTVDGLVVWNSIAPGVAFIEPGAKPPIPVTSPGFHVIAMPVRDQADLEEGLADALKQEGVDLRSVKTTNVRIDGADAEEMEGDATRDGVRLKFYGMLMVEKAGVILEMGEYLATQPEALVRMRKLARTTHRLDDVLGPIDFR